MKKVSAAFIVWLLVFTTFLGHSSVQAKEAHVKNVIFMIPDGFSTAYATSYRWYKGEKSLMDEMLVGMHRTYSANSAVTDSAAGGTAMATGQKTNNGMIATAPTGEKLPTILQAARANGKGTGLVTTTTITYATPAAFASHVKKRTDEANIAPQLISNKVDVLLGGGKKFFSESLLKKAQEEGYQLVTDQNMLRKTKVEKKVLGLFSEEALSPELDRHYTDQPSLADMTMRAIDHLKKKKKGFFLMVEGGQIDWAGHANDPVWAMKDIEAFEEAVKVAKQFAEEDQNTLIVIAGDHDTGGFSVGGYNRYAANVKVLRKVKATGQFIANQLNQDRSNSKEVMKKYTGLNLTAQEMKEIQTSAQAKLAVNKIISKRALIGWTTHEHTGVDVPVYAFGPGSEQFRGLQENTDLPRIMAKLMNLSYPFEKNS